MELYNYKIKSSDYIYLLDLIERYHKEDIIEYLNNSDDYDPESYSIESYLNQQDESNWTEELIEHGL